MTYIGVISSKMDKKREKTELKDLKRLLEMKGEFSEDQVLETWNSLKNMQEELELPSLYPMRYHYYFYSRLEEIKIALSPFPTDFHQLNQLYVEINCFRDLLGLPVTSSISQVISLIRKKSLDELMALEIGSDSLFLNILLLQLTTKRNFVSEKNEKPTIVHRLDRRLLEILISYGPCTRAELVEVTGVARSSIYDSLRRLELKGLITMYSDNIKNVGRPMTLFDALI
ncbi:MAG: helix-turn-helix domain-containing protein [Candidatus Hodarchaeales archaeon]|jgi:chromosome segregation and condensation protein ScpB